MSINYSKEAVRDLKKLPMRTRLRIIEKIELLADDRGKLANNIKFVAQYKCYRLKVGNYRVFYSEDGTILWIEGVKHRREAYR